VGESDVQALEPYGGGAADVAAAHAASLQEDEARALFESIDGGEWWACATGHPPMSPYARPSSTTEAGRGNAR
jgi:hypothetical protein